MLKLITFKVLILFSLVSEGIVRKVPSENYSKVAIFNNTCTKIYSIGLQLKSSFIRNIFSLELLKFKLDLSIDIIFSSRNLREINFNQLVIHFVPLS